MQAVDTLEGKFTDDDGEVRTRFNHWDQLFDFTKREDGQLNYSLQAPEDFTIAKPSETLEKDFGADSDDWIFELPVAYGGTYDSGAQTAAKDNLQTFDITVGAAKAQELFDATQA